MGRSVSRPSGFWFHVCQRLFGGCGPESCSTLPSLENWPSGGPSVHQPVQIGRLADRAALLSDYPVQHRLEAAGHGSEAVRSAMDLVSPAVDRAKRAARIHYVDLRHAAVARELVTHLV